MFHWREDGLDKPITFSSQTLTPAEKKYSQLEKEGLAMVFGVKRFHQYLYGREMTMLSDHKPLQNLFRESRVTCSSLSKDATMVHNPGSLQLQDPV